MREQTVNAAYPLDNARLDEIRRDALRGRQ